ncbi:MAG: hypothetical protein FJW20_06195 [Acidimicrobiia bacterium]|nr:hypothetical protein [Acidimicrobiia bacterium]
MGRSPAAPFRRFSFSQGDLECNRPLDRIRHTAEIDYLRASDSLEQREKAIENAPRNAPCPCGSGRKYKRCCGVHAAPVLGAPRAA